MTLPITTLYAVLLTSWLIILSLRVIDLRGSPVTRFLHPPDHVVDPKTLKRAVRGHANLTEYMPAFLILLGLAELHAQPVWALHVAGVAFTMGRVMHGTVFCFTKPSLPGRIGGMVLTLNALLFIALADAHALITL